MKIKKTLSMIFWGALMILCIVIPIKIINFVNSKIDESIKKNAKYTIGTTTELIGRGRGLNIRFVYRINNQLYEESETYRVKMKVPNGRYYVRYDSTAVDNCELLQGYSVPDSITEAPANGWTEIPK